MLFALPLLGKNILKEGDFYDYIADTFFYGLLFCYLSLGYLGSMPAETPYVELSQFFTFIYFALFLLPLFSN
jgi:ubiquinol-cytochrome c reductase cytochrome b/c1 subunit